MTTLANRIKRARKAAGLSQQALANAINHFGGSISRSAIAQWESGRIKEMEAANLLRAAIVLKVKPEWIQFGYSQECAKKIPLLNFEEITAYLKGK